MMDNLDKVFSRAFANYKPPENLTVSEWAAKYRMLSRESSAEAGKWRNERTPYMVEIMDAFTDVSVNKITVVASSQVGKSEVELNMIGYIIDQNPGSILYIQPTLEDAKKFSKQRVAPMIRDCPVLSKKVIDASENSKSEKGNTILQKTFPGGLLTMIGSNSPSALASTPIKYVIGDERDRWAFSAGREGDPWKLAEARTTTFFASKMVDVSTPTIKGASAIETSYNAGTMETWQQQCPCCDKYHEIDFDNIKFDFDVIKIGKKKEYIVKSIYWVCPDCGYMADEREMRQQPSKWIANNPSALVSRGHRSFWLKGFSSPWQPWEKIIYAFLEAKDDPQRLKVVYNTMLGKLWEVREDIEDEDVLMQRRERYGTHADGTAVDLPDGVLVLTCGVDTQDDRLEYEVVGYGKFYETWGIKSGFIPGDPHENETWEKLDDIIDHVYTFADGKGLKISMTLVDSGGHRTQDVYQQCKKRVHKRVFAIKGKGGADIPYIRPPTKVKIMVNQKTIGETWLYTIGVDSGKSDIIANIQVQEPGAKYCHFPIEPEKGYDTKYFNGLLSENFVQKTENGRTKWAWVKLPGHERNEALDCRNYANAACRVIDPDFDAVAARLHDTSAKKEKPKPIRRQKRKTDLYDEW